MAYAELDVLRARLDLKTDASDATLRRALDWATAWIDNYTGRTFEASGTLTRYYDDSALDPNSDDLLVLDEDLLTVSSLVNGDDDATVLGTATYWLWPRNQTPKWGIKLKSDYDWEVDTDYFIAVTGTWGYQTTPDDLIVGACLRLAEWKYRSKDLVETVSPYSLSITTKMPEGFPGEVIGELEPRRRLV